MALCLFSPGRALSAIAVISICIHSTSPSLSIPPPPSTSLAAAVNFGGPQLAPAFIMADDIVIDKQLFHERLSNFVTKWKTDKRAGDQIFQGAGSIATVVGKASEEGSYLKPAAFQVSCQNL